MIACASSQEYTTLADPPESTTPEDAIRAKCDYDGVRRTPHVLIQPRWPPAQR